MSLRMGTLVELQKTMDKKENNCFRKPKRWIMCPICKNKIWLKIREDTEVINFPLFCTKCKKETLVNIKDMEIFIIHEPDV